MTVDPVPSTEAPAPPKSPVRPSGDHVIRIADVYRSGQLGESWAELPEVWSMPSAEPKQQRLWITFVAAVDRARDAERLWKAAHQAWDEQRWVFDPGAVAAAPFVALAEALRRFGLSQRHLPDVGSWRAIAEALASPECPVAITRALDGADVSATQVLDALDSTWPHGTRMFPQLSGPKIGPMWVRMLVYPGGAAITGMDVIPVAVDTHVQRVTEMLGLVTPHKLDERHRSRIEAAWFAAVRGVGSFGAPDGIDGTAAGIDPALWVLGKEACSKCEKAEEKIPVGAICELCVLGRIHAGDPSPRE